jgi:hypothetical protein
MLDKLVGLSWLECFKSLIFTLHNSGKYLHCWLPPNTPTTPTLPINKNHDMVTGSLCTCLYYNNHSSANCSTKSRFSCLQTTNIMEECGADTLRTGLKGNEAALLVFISSCLEGQDQKRGALSSMLAVD